ncbi:MAG: hypothetical protein B7C24_13905 [Bacteroidetes bacterium 4572_77]|nr:MAG: hypothetical protein B7C24_13905 [Bacteroidetes bacterium 4572_77]
MALNIISTEINPSSSNTYLNTTLRLIANKTIDGDSCSDATIYLYKLPEYQRYGITIETQDTELRISSSDIFLQNTQYQLILLKGSSGVLALDTEELDENYILDFTTGTLLEPATTETPEEILDEIDNVLDVTDTAHADHDIVVPDVNLSGGLQPFLACEPTGSTNTGSGGETNTSGEVITNTVYVVNSEPAAYSVGITDIHTINLFWNENVNISGIDILTLNSQSLIPPIDPFAKTIIVPTSNTAVTNRIVTREFTSENTTNLEYTATINAGNVTSIDGTKTNLTYNLVFSGPLYPVLCTVEQVKANAGLWNQQFTAKDYYYYYKLLHKESIAIIAAAGYNNVGEITEPTELISLSKYVCCVVAMYMLVYGSPNSNTVQQTFGTYVKKRDLPGFSITYDVMSGSSESNSPTSEIMKRLTECLKNNAPRSVRDIINNDITHPIYVDHGVKSVQDPSRPIRRRN